MITVAAAKQLIKENCNKIKAELLPLNEVLGLVLANEVYSIIDTPPFNQSAVDGYAFSFKDWDKKSVLKVSGEIQAGNLSHAILKPLEAIRIFTGAALPQGTDTVVMQEKVIATEKNISINDDQLAKGMNVRQQGSQINKNGLILQAGHLLTPASIALIAGCGIDKVKVYANPTVGIIITGKELVQPGQPIPAGKLFEANSFGLIAACKQLNIAPNKVHVVDDDENLIINAIKNQLHYDIIILTGGISVGDYDFVASALDKCGIKEVFHKIKQKPGKPLYFGKHNQTLIFGLPGNPASMLSCFYKYVVPAISSFTMKNYFKKLKLPLANDFIKKPGLTFFLKGKTSTVDVSILENQESYKMNSFALADCLVELEEDKGIFKKGDLVDVDLIV